MENYRITFRIILCGYGLLLNLCTVTSMTWNAAFSANSLSDIPGFTASNAIDGDPSTCFRSKENGSYTEVALTIDLGTPNLYNIYAVTITTSHLGLPGVFNNFEFEIINVFTSNDRPMCYRENTTVPESTHVLYLCEPGGIGSMLYIKPMNSSNPGTLTVCEVEVLARPVEFDLMCRESGFSFNETPTYESVFKVSAVGCALMCKQTGCDTYISKKENGVDICMLYSGRKFVLNENVNSSFYFNC